MSETGKQIDNIKENLILTEKVLLLMADKIKSRDPELKDFPSKLVVQMYFMKAKGQLNSFDL